MRISVVIPACNAAATIADAVASVLAQTHTAWRLLIVDDGSTDDTAAILARLADPRFTVLRQPNAGVSAARNRGMAASDADADALLFLDADDWLAPTALATLAATLHAAPRAAAAVGAWAVTGNAPQPRAYRPPAVPIDLLPGLLIRNRFANGGHVLIRHDAARRAGSFHPGIAYGEDWEFFIRLALQGRFTFAPTREPLLFVRSRAEGAYRRLAADPGAFAPCMAAIFDNPALARRFGATRLAALRRRTEAENAWIIGREHIRQNRAGEGWRWLLRSVAVAPSPRRAALLAAALAAPLLPQAWRGPFRAYAPAHSPTALDMLCHTHGRPRDPEPTPQPARQPEPG